MPGRLDGGILRGEGAAVSRLKVERGGELLWTGFKRDETGVGGPLQPHNVCCAGRKGS